jgi:putative zinc finger/helix-turn-helix protein, ygiT family
MKTESQFCSCGSDATEIRTETRKMEILGEKHEIPKEYYHCVSCGEEWVTPEQSKATTDKITAIKRRAQGFLAPQDIKALRERHGLTQKQAAIIFGGGDNAFSKYERGEIYPSAAMDKLMCLFNTIPEVKKRLIQQSDLSDIEKAILLPTDDVIKNTAVAVVAFHHYQPAIAGVR